MQPSTRHVNGERHIVGESEYQLLLLVVERGMHLTPQEGDGDWHVSPYA